eukprot:150059-Prorocentrum_minimum.AAC.1
MRIFPRFLCLIGPSLVQNCRRAYARLPHPVTSLDRRSGTTRCRSASPRGGVRVVGRWRSAAVCRRRGHNERGVEVDVKGVGCGWTVITEEHSVASTFSHGWEEYVDPAGHVYYHNSHTGVTQWECPPEMDPAAARLHRRCGTPTRPCLIIITRKTPALHGLDHA